MSVEKIEEDKKNEIKTKWNNYRKSEIWTKRSIRYNRITSERE